MKALVIVEKGKAEVIDKPEPKVAAHYVKVKVDSVALNPSNGETVGCDYSGIVTEIGPDVTADVKVGDAVYGLVHGSKLNRKDTGCFAEYCIAKEGVLYKKPSNISFEAASTFGVSIITQVLGLFKQLKLPTPDHPAKEPFPILIFGGSSGMGMIAIQLAKLAGLYVVTTASKRNFALVTGEYGADAVFDYSEPDVGKKINQLTKNKLRYVYDCIGEKGSPAIAAEALASHDVTGEGLLYCPLLTVKDFPRDDVINQGVLGYTCFGEDFEFLGTNFSARPDDYAACKENWPMINQLIAQGKLKPSRFEVKNGGVDGILDGLKVLQEGRNSGLKLVYKISDTQSSE